MENIKKVQFERYSNSRATKYVNTILEDEDFSINIKHEVVKPSFKNEFKSFFADKVYNKVELIPTKEEISHFLTEKRNSLDKEAIRLKKIQEEKEAQLKLENEIEKAGSDTILELSSKEIIKGYDFIIDDLNKNKNFTLHESEIPYDEEMHFDFHNNEDDEFIRCSLLVLFSLGLLGKTTIVQTMSYGYHNRDKFVYDEKDYNVYMFKRNTYDRINYSHIIQSNDNYFKITLGNIDYSDLIYKYSVMLYFLKNATIEKI